MNAEEYLLVLQAYAEELQKELDEQQWSSYSVQEKIRRLAVENGVDPSLALNIACAESHFNPNARNPHSTAGGVFQWLNSSWAHNSTKYYGYVEDKMNVDRNIELSIWVLRDRGSADWNASRSSGVGGGWEAKPYENGFCPIA